MCKAASRRAGREQTKLCGKSAAIGRLEKIPPGCLREALTVGNFCEEQCVPTCSRAPPTPAALTHRSPQLSRPLRRSYHLSRSMTQAVFGCGARRGKIELKSPKGESGASNAQACPHVRLPHALRLPALTDLRDPWHRLYIYLKEAAAALPCRARRFEQASQPLTAPRVRRCSGTRVGAVVRIWAHGTRPARSELDAYVYEHVFALLFGRIRVTSFSDAFPNLGRLGFLSDL